MPTPSQCRAARAMLHWSVAQLADASGVGEKTIRSLEQAARVPMRANRAAIRDALEAAGIIFIPTASAEGPGVRFSDPRRT